MNKGITAVLTGCLLLVAGSVQAATFNFRTLIDTNVGTITGIKADGVAFSGNPGELAFRTFDWTDAGITLTATGTHVTDTSTYAYLDKDKAGLGVCKNVTGTGNQCSPSSDDNVTVGERLNLDFNQLVSIDLNNLELRDANHNLYTGVPDEIRVSINGGSYAQLSTLTALNGTQFRFKTIADSGQFYISNMTVTAVPEPSTWLLMGFGLAGLLMLRRKA